MRIAVVHPVESLWLHLGQNDQTKRRRNDLNNRFDELTEWLLYGTLDFDFICESLLPSQYRETESGFAVGKMTYDTVIVPSLETIRSTTLDALKKFRAAGGEVIFLGEAPSYLLTPFPSEAAKALPPNAKTSLGSAESFTMRFPNIGSSIFETLTAAPPAISFISSATTAHARHSTSSSATS